ncbi:hypothetical protein P4O66_002980 [Electrophorus voltai]|uniref:Immunoglobulin V-set domain-containing protein n=1 Tax=Electrophorus voltai TaxID=2609070 RepID=A0AAD9DMU3_9TELE|nr:hypothetical protein P4O66_002980 [Electrophorus voltai]
MERALLILTLVSVGKFTPVGGDWCTCVKSTIPISHYVYTITTMMVLCSLALFITILSDCSSQSVTPLNNRMHIHALEGEPVILSYKYDGNVQTLQWYRQNSGSRPEYLLMIFPSENSTVIHGTPQLPQLDAEVKIKDKKVNLLISPAAVSDSALYYCALVPTVTGSPAPLYKNLLLQT